MEHDNERWIKSRLVDFLKHLLIAALVLLVATRFSAAQSSAPTARAKNMCNYAKVINLRPGRFLSVRSGPGAKFRAIDKLSLGKEVYVCDEHFYWYKVFYSDPNAPRNPCSVSSVNGIDANKAKGCKSGWVKRDWIDLISG
jgi:hypothetical protein